MEEKKNYKIPSILKKAAIQGYVYRWSTVVDNWIEERVLGLSWNSFKWIFYYGIKWYLAWSQLCIHFMGNLAWDMFSYKSFI